MQLELFEAGHGKWAADAIGGILKCCADGAINTGSEIADTEDVFDLRRRHYSYGHLPLVIHVLYPRHNEHPPSDFSAPCKFASYRVSARCLPRVLPYLL